MRRRVIRAGAVCVIFFASCSGGSAQSSVSVDFLTGYCQGIKELTDVETQLTARAISDPDAAAMFTDASNLIRRSADQARTSRVASSSDVTNMLALADASTGLAVAFADGHLTQQIAANTALGTAMASAPPCP